MQKDVFKEYAELKGLMKEENNSSLIKARIESLSDGAVLLSLTNVLSIIGAVGYLLSAFTSEVLIPIFILFGASYIVFERTERKNRELREIYFNNYVINLIGNKKYKDNPNFESFKKYVKFLLKYEVENYIKKEVDGKSNNVNIEDLIGKHYVKLEDLDFLDNNTYNLITRLVNLTGASIIKEYNPKNLLTEFTEFKKINIATLKKTNIDQLLSNFSKDEIAFIKEIYHPSSNEISLKEITSIVYELNYEKRNNGVRTQNLLNIFNEKQVSIYGEIELKIIESRKESTSKSEKENKNKEEKLKELINSPIFSKEEKEEFVKKGADLGVEIKLKDKKETEFDKIKKNIEKSENEKNEIDSLYL